MLITHIYLNGQCKEAIALYQKAFQAEVRTIILNPDNQKLVIHAELVLHEQLLYLNDYGNMEEASISGGYQLCVTFQSDEELRATFDIMKEGSKLISPMQPTDYSSCVVRFIDEFDVRWAFMTEK